MCLCVLGYVWERQRWSQKDQNSGEEDNECFGVNGLLMGVFASQDHGQHHREIPNCKQEHNPDPYDGNCN